MKADIIIALGLVVATVGISAKLASDYCSAPAPGVRLPVANLTEANRLSQPDALGRYFDCLEYEVETSTLQTCEQE